MSDNIIRPEQWLSNGAASLESKGERVDAASDRLGGGGDGPHNPRMDQRVATLEADMKDVKGSLGRIETTLAVVAEGMKVVATKTELTALSGRVDSLSVKVDKVERDVSTALTTAIGKAIGPVQFVAMIGTSVVIFVAGVGAYGWITAQPLFHH